MSRRRGRRSRDWVALIEEISALRSAEPWLTANEIQRRVGARRSAVLRIVAVLSAAEAGRASQDVRTIPGPYPTSEVVPQMRHSGVANPSRGASS
jgi:hypothetical protein